MKNILNVAGFIAVMIAGFMLIVFLFDSQPDDVADGTIVFEHVEVEFIDRTILFTIFPKESMSCADFLSFTSKEIELPGHRYILDSKSCNDKDAGIISITYREESPI